MRAWIVSPKGSSLNRRLRAIEQSSHTRGNFSGRYALLGTSRPDEHVDLAVVERLLAHGDAHRDAEEICIRELLPRALVPVVQDHRVARGLEVGGEALRGFRDRGPGGGDRHDVDVVGRHRGRPDDPVLVVVLLDDRRHDAARTDAVTPAEKGLLLAVLVEEGRPERLRVEAPEVEDVPDLDRGAEDERTAAHGATVALLRLPQVGEARLV